MGEFAEKLKKYFEETPQEQLDADWEKIKHLNEIGPDVEEYVNFYRGEIENKKTEINNMNTKVKLLCVSIAPAYYDSELLSKIGGMTYDEAKAFMEEFSSYDNDLAFSVTEKIIDLTRSNEIRVSADGAEKGDTCDTMFTWVKVIKD